MIQHVPDPPPLRGRTKSGEPYDLTRTPGTTFSNKRVLLAVLLGCVALWAVVIWLFVR